MTTSSVIIPIDVNNYKLADNFAEAVAIDAHAPMVPSGGTWDTVSAVASDLACNAAGYVTAHASSGSSDLAFSSVELGANFKSRLVIDLDSSENVKFYFRMGVNDVRFITGSTQSGYSLRLKESSGTLLLKLTKSTILSTSEIADTDGNATEAARGAVGNIDPTSTNRLVCFIEVINDQLKVTINGDTTTFDLDDYSDHVYFGIMPVNTSTNIHEIRVW